jgi:hypothetical protein
MLPEKLREEGTIAPLFAASPFSRCTDRSNPMLKPGGGGAWLLYFLGTCTYPDDVAAGDMVCWLGSPRPSPSPRGGGRWGKPLFW